MLVHRRLDAVGIAAANRLERALVYAERMLGVTRIARRGVACELEPLEHQRHQLDESGVGRRPGERQVEAEIELQKAGPVVERPTLELDDLGELVEVRAARRAGSQLRDLRLQQATSFQHVGDLGGTELCPVLDQTGRNGVGANEGTAPGTRANLDDARVGQDAEGLTDGGPADLHPLGEGALGGQLVAHP